MNESVNILYARTDSKNSQRNLARISSKLSNVLLYPMKSYPLCSNRAISGSCMTNMRVAWNKLLTILEAKVSYLHILHVLAAQKTESCVEL